MTPYQVDELIRKMPLDGPDAAHLLHLASFGAEFQKHLSASLREAGITQVSDAQLEVRMNTPMNLIDITKNNIAHSRLNGTPTQSAEAFLAWLKNL